MFPYAVSTQTTTTEVIQEEVEIPKKTRKNDNWKNWKNLWFYFGDAELKWTNIILLGSVHLFGVYALYYSFIGNPIRSLIIIQWILGYWGALGVTAGAHRLYTHRCYKANKPLKIFLVTGYLLAGMNSLFNWVRDHRVHHKFTDTEADPHNATRGFFFSHVGWLLMKKHPAVKREGRKIDMSDILDDPIARFQEKHFPILSLMVAHVLPITLTYCFLNVTLWDCFCLNMARWIITLNGVWSVNSAAHIWGTKPYDHSIKPTENRFVAIFAIGEGWHNYHHTFPWDYKAAEHGWWLNVTGIILDFWAAMGWAYDLKTPSPELIQRVANAKGDGSRYVWGKEVPISEDKQS